MTESDDSTRNELKIIYKELKEYFDELQGESARAAAILAVAAMEDALEALLRKQFPAAQDDNLWKKLAGPGFKPLSSLTSKADFAQAFDFYGPKTRKTIDLVGSVRNKFAHRTYIRTFDHPEVWALCKKLEGNPIFQTTFIDEPKASDIRWYYINIVGELTDYFSKIRYHVPELDEPITILP